MASAWTLEALEAFPLSDLRELAAKHGLPHLFNDVEYFNDLRAAVAKLHKATPCAVDVPTRPSAGLLRARRLATQLCCIGLALLWGLPLYHSWLARAW